MRIEIERKRVRKYCRNAAFNSLFTLTKHKLKNENEMKQTSQEKKGKMRILKHTFSKKFLLIEITLFMIFQIIIYVWKKELFSNVLTAEDTLTLEFQEYNKKFLINSASIRGSKIKYSSFQKYARKDFYSFYDIKREKNISYRPKMLKKDAKQIYEEEKSEQRGSRDFQNTNSREKEALERREILDIKNFVHLSASHQEEYWGTGISSSWAELHFPLLSYNTNNLSSDIFQFEPFILSTWIYLDTVGTSDDRIIFMTKAFTEDDLNVEEMKLVIHKKTLQLTYQGIKLKGNNKVPLKLKTWSHIGIVMEGTNFNRFFRVYIDTVLITVGSIPRDERKIFSGKTILGRNFNGKEALEGNLAMLCVWNEKRNDDYNAIMKSVYRAGFNEDKILNLGSEGLVKPPSLLYTFKAQKETSLEDLIFNQVLEDQASSIHGSIHYGIYFHARESWEGSFQQKPKGLLRLRQLHIKQAAARTFQSYREYALGQDELIPSAKFGRNSKGKFSTTLVGGLDTLYLMSLQNEFKDARNWIEAHLNFEQVDVTSLYFVVSRICGGLLSAFDLSGDDVFFLKAKLLIEKLLPTFATLSGLPFSQVDLKNKRFFNSAGMEDIVPLSEIGNIQVELRYFASVIQKPFIAKTAEKVYDVLDALSLSNSKKIFPEQLKNRERVPSTIMEGGESFFGENERTICANLLRMYIQGGMKEFHYRKMYDDAVQTAKRYLRRTKKNKLIYFVESQNNIISESMCGFAGTLALGAYTHPLGKRSEVAKQDLKIAKALAQTCHEMYLQAKTGLSSSYMITSEDGNSDTDFLFPTHDAQFHLKSSFVESLFILYQLTGEYKYQEWGWKIFESIETFCRTDIAYSSLVDVNEIQRGHLDIMSSDYLAKTLKYLYLMQGEVDVLENIYTSGGHQLRLNKNLEPVKWMIMQSMN